MTGETEEGAKWGRILPLRWAGKSGQPILACWQLTSQPPTHARDARLSGGALACCMRRTERNDRSIGRSGLLNSRSQPLTRKALRCVALGLCTAAIYVASGLEASTQVGCAKEVAEIERLRTEILAAIPKPPQISLQEYNKRRQEELYRANHCRNLLRQRGSCTALLQTYRSGQKCE